jgi:RcsF protein
LLTTSALLLLGGCAGEYRFNSNLDAKAIDDYFKASDVRLFEGNNQPDGPFESLGLVEGEACQAQATDVPPTLADARTEVRRAAADKGATGLIIKQCRLFDETAQGCITRAFCIGQAIKQPQANQK